MKAEQDKIVFDSGAERYAYRSIVGIGPDLVVTHGYDGQLFNHELPDDESLTSAECLELAEYMISRWREFGERFGSPRRGE